VPNQDPADIPRPLFTRRPEAAHAPLSAPEPPAERGENFRPQYVSLHSLREHGHGPRNLAWGVVTLLLALLLVGGSLFISGAQALLPLLTCLLTFTALFVLARMHVFRQRNGGFLALGIVALFGAAIPLLQVAFHSLDTFVKNRPAAVTPVVTLSGIAPPAPTGEILSLIEAFALTAPDLKAGPLVRITKDARVTVEGKTYLVRAGDQFTFAARKGRDVTIAARDLLITVPAEATEVIEEKPTGVTPPTVAEPAAPEQTTAQRTAASQREAIRRYPALGIKGSLENQMFVSLYTELRDNGGDDFFANPEWPIELAELLAQRERWQLGAPPATTGPNDPPAEPTSPN